MTSLGPFKKGCVWKEHRLLTGDQLILAPLVLPIYIFLGLEEYGFDYKFPKSNELF